MVGSWRRGDTAVMLRRIKTSSKTETNQTQVGDAPPPTDVPLTAGINNLRERILRNTEPPPAPPPTVPPPAAKVTG